MFHVCKIITMCCIAGSILMMEINASTKINISGKVTDFSGSPVLGATVKIKDAGQSATTDSEGNFTISGSTGILASTGTETVQHFAILRKGQLEIQTSKRTLAGITVFNLSGKEIFQKKQSVEAGNHTFSLSDMGNGISLIRVHADGKTAHLKISALGRTLFGNVQGEKSLISSGTLAKSTASPFDDTLFVTKSGFLEYALRISKNEISGLKIRVAKSDHPKVTKGTIPKPSVGMVHASTILELEDGTLLAAFYGGSSEGAKDVQEWVSRKTPGGEWSAPKAVADGKLPKKNIHWTCGNPILFQPYGGEVHLYYHVINHTFWLGRYKTSSDGGQTWSEIKDLGDDKFIGPVKNKPVQLADGTIVSGSSTENNKTGTRGWRAHVERSTDGGKTWEFIGPLPPANGVGPIQPTIMIYPPGTKLQMMCRTYHGYDKIAESWSEDGGKTWSELKASVLPNNNSGFDAVTLRDGRQLLVYNHSTRGGIGGKGRGLLTLSISKNGKDWEAALILQLDKGGRNSYPAVIQSRDGLVHVTCTHNRGRIKHDVINPALLTETVPMPDGKWPTNGPLSINAYTP